MKRFLISFPDDEQQELHYQTEVEDAFIWTGLKEAPSWLQDLVEDGEAVVYPSRKGLMISHKNGYAFYDKGDLVIRRSKDEYEVVRRMIIWPT